MSPDGIKTQLASVSTNENIYISALPKYLQDAFLSRKCDKNVDGLHTILYDMETVNGLGHDSIQTKLFQLLLHREWVTEKMIRHGKCYPQYISQRARVYETLQYHDLAAFDAYVVYTLCQKELSDDFVTDLVAHDLDDRPWLENIDDHFGNEQRMQNARYEKVSALTILVRCLAQIGATADAAKLWQELREELGRLQGTEVGILSEQKLASWSELSDVGRNMNDMEKVPDLPKPFRFGYSRREIYPWSIYEASRNSANSVGELNQYLSDITPHLEAKVTALPAFDESGNVTEDTSYQLGLFAKIHLKPGQEVLAEKSILTAIRPLEDALCDACGQELENIPFTEMRQCDGDDCDITFCSQECKDRAVKEYHRPQVHEDEEDGDEDEENDAVEDGDATHSGDEDQQGPTDSTNGTVQDKTYHQDLESPDLTSCAPFCGATDLLTIGRPTNTTTPEWDLYFLLLTRTISMSLTQSIHPLNLPETKYLWGAFNPSPFAPNTPLDPNHKHQRTLPFSFLHNLQYILDYFSTLSMSEPRATPYSPHWLRTFDFWVLQTLFAKFRGVANATQSTFDGKPEIAAVHPGWSLANHSCNPNVRWTPTGTRKLFVRMKEERADFKRQDEGENDEWTGIKAGEEIFSHYTDIRLPVQERRERLRQVLGGNCRCDRCMTESQDVE